MEKLIALWAVPLTIVVGCSPRSLDQLQPETVTLGFAAPPMELKLRAASLMLNAPPTATRFDGTIVSGDLVVGFAFGRPETEPWRSLLSISRAGDSYCPDPGPTAVQGGAAPAVFVGDEHYEYTAEESTLTFDGSCAGPVRGVLSVQWGPAN